MANILCYLVRFSPALQPCHVRELTFLLAEMGAVSLHKIGQLSLTETVLRIRIRCLFYPGIRDG
jgi:hypothetical protein